MPEGPSIVIAKEEMTVFVGKKIIEANGNAKIDIDSIEGKVLTDVKSWGKHLLLCFDDFTVRIHFLLFGSYLVNETKSAAIRLGLVFKNGHINFYAASVKILEGNADAQYDWSADVMNDDWNSATALKKLSDNKQELICDVLLDQDIFSGVGNIIKNEVLFRVGVHPNSLVDKIPSKKLKEIVEQARIYSFDFLKWKKDFVLKKHWLVHTKKVCVQCDNKLIKEYTGKKKRRSFFCTTCQKLYV
ncbi:MAG: endonuclease [Flavobacterium sp.]|uniref:DNA-formamidopyrimidine glycosylase family protein n=1 Tax=Flavobacterium sp. TaxID=239 RepID=UPI002FCB27FD